MAVRSRGYKQSFFSKIIKYNNGKIYCLGKRKYYQHQYFPRVKNIATSSIMVFSFLLYKGPGTQKNSEFFSLNAQFELLYIALLR